MEITLMHHTPLDVCAYAIRTCWQSFDKSDNGGEKDKALIDRVGNKYKHASTLEHLVICVAIDSNEVAQIFKENSFSIVTKVDGKWINSTNVRALQEIDLPLEIKLELLPKKYKYLF